MFGPLYLNERVPIRFGAPKAINMTRFLLFFLLLLISLTPVAAQSYQVTESNTMMDKTSMNVAVVEIEAPRDRVEEILVDYLEDRYKIDLDRKNKEKQSVTWLADQIEIRDLNNGAIDLWAKVAATGENRTSVMLAASKGYDNSISSATDARAYRNLEMISDNFTKYFYRTYYDQQLELKTEAVEEATEQREDLIKENKKLTEDIAKKEKEIAEAKAQIQKNETELETLQPRIEALKSEEAIIRGQSQQWGEPIDPKKVRKRKRRS